MKYVAIIALFLSGTAFGLNHEPKDVPGVPQIGVVKFEKIGKITVKHIFVANPSTDVKQARANARGR